MFFNGYDIPSNLSFDLFRENSIILKLAFFDFTIISPLAIFGVFLVRGKYRWAGLLYLFWGVLSLAVIAFHIQGRYRLAAVPFFILFAAYTLYWFYIMLIIQRKFIIVAWASLSLFIIILYTKPDQKIIQTYFGSRIREIDYGNLATAYQFVYLMDYGKLSSSQRDKLLQNAICYYQRAIATPSIHKPYSPPQIGYLTSLGVIYFELLQIDEAHQIFQQILALDPQNRIAHEYLNKINSITLINPN